MSTPILTFRPMLQGDKIKSRTKPDFYTNPNYQAWVTVASAREPGLFLASNEFKSFSNNYGSSTTDGSIGYDWSGNTVAGSGNATGYRPSPMVTSLEVEEGLDNTLTRRASFTITAHSYTQAKELITYFLEPGYTIFLQWGWSTASGQAIRPSKKENVTDFAKKVAGFQWPSGAETKRKQSGWEYDNYVGLVVGGNIEQDGDKWNINVKCNGLSELTLYKPGSSTAYDDDANIEIQTVEYTPAEISQARGNSANNARFRLMFNELPSNRRTKNIRDYLIKQGLQDWKRYINFDPNVVATLNDKTSYSFLKTFSASWGKSFFNLGGFFTFAGAPGGGAGGAAVIASAVGLWDAIVARFSNKTTTEVENQNVEIESGTELVTTRDRYIHFGAAITILNAIDTDGIGLVNGSKLSYKINIDNVRISAFPKIFSTKKDILFIPNKKSPNISIAYAIQNTTQQTKFNDTKDNSVGGFKFPETYEIPEKNPYKPKGAEGSTGITRPAETWGWLKDLYINFDLFKSIIEKPNVSLKDMLYQMLNEMSNAAGGMWDFQIYQYTEKNITYLTVEDINLISIKGPNPKPSIFDISGKNSPFISTTFNMEMSGKMINKVVSERLGAKTDTTGTTVKDTPGTLVKDLVVTSLEVTEAKKDKDKANEKTKSNDIGEVDQDEIDKKKVENLARFLEKVAIVPNPRFISSQVENESDFDKCIIVAAYDDMALFESLKMGNENTTIDGSSGIGVLTNIQFGFTVHGISGVRRGDTFKINGSPYGYVSKGFFQVTNIKHTLSGNFWTTEITGGFRPMRTAKTK